MKGMERQEVHHSAEMVAQDPNHQRSEMIGTEEENCAVVRGALWQEG